MKTSQQSLRVFLLMASSLTTRKGVAILFALLLIPPDCFGLDSCSEIDMGSQLGPVQDQKDLSWCYAYTASDLLTQALRSSGDLTAGLSQKESQPSSGVSALQLAHDFLRHENKSLINTESGGRVHHALERTLERGRLCSNEDLPAENGTSNPTLIHINKEHIERLVQAYSYPKIGSRVAQVGRIARNLSEDEIAKKCQRKLSTKFEVETYAGWSKEDRRSTYRSQVERYTEKLNSILETGRMASLSYDANFLLDQPGTGYHGSTIIGRKRVAGRCHFLLRNSWGPNCKVYASPYDKQCEGGVLTIDAEQLMKHSLVITHIPQVQNSQPRLSAPPATKNYRSAR